MTLNTAQQKQGPNAKIKQTIGATIIINQQQHTHRLRALSRSYWGLKLFYWPNLRPRLCCC